MPFFAWILIGVVSLLIIAFIISIVGAREGWENGDGFHFGRKE